MQPRKDLVLGDLQLEDKLPICLLTCMELAEAVPYAITGLHHEPPFPIRILYIREHQH